MSEGQLPFSAVVGLDEAKLALILNAVDRGVGGVLLRGQKGSAKSTLARGLAALLPDRAPFVELPIGATEDRLVGTLDLAAALTGGEYRFAPGLLAAADGGVLYVDEINLLPDHLVDVLLDVAASGINRVEREGISHVHSSRFLLIGSMNPEEGDLRPQLLDRFGLAVDVRAALDPATRAAAVRGRLAFDADPVGVATTLADDEAELAGRLAAAKPAVLPDEMVEAIAALCSAVGAEGLRADLTICRAAAALAGWEGRSTVTETDVRRVAPLALAHRARRDPLEPAGLDEERLAQALDEHLSEGAGGDRPPADPGPATVTPLPGAGVTDRRHPAAAAGRRVSAVAARGRLVGDRAPDGPIGSVAVAATVRRAAARDAAAPGEPLVRPDDLRQAVRVQRTANLIVLAVDASGSMGAPLRMEAAKGAVLGLLTDAYQHRDLVALVAFGGDDATVLLRPTGSVEVAQARLAQLPTGGRTPLAAGLSTALAVATAPGRAATHRPLLVVITDGRATAGPPGVDPVEAASAAADQARLVGVEAVVIDVEDTGRSTGQPALGLARELAARMGARHLRLAEVTPAAVQLAVRAALA
jgi:magnesium chelatase subunit D